MQTCDTTLEEALVTHLVETILIGIAKNVTRKGKEEIDSKIAMRHNVVRNVGRIAFHHVEANDTECCHTSESVQDLISWF